jgi:hypothetical protein
MSIRSIHDIMTKTVANQGAHVAPKVGVRNAPAKNQPTDAMAKKRATPAIVKPSLNSMAKVLTADLTAKAVTPKNHFAAKPAVSPVVSQVDAPAADQVDVRVENPLVAAMTDPMPDAKLTSDRHLGHQY